MFVSVRFWRNYEKSRAFLPKMFNQMEMPQTARRLQTAGRRFVRRMSAESELRSRTGNARAESRFA
jgi:hypothetical protein